MDRATVKKLHSDLNDTLEALGKKYGMKLRTGTLRFGADGIKVQVTGAVVSTAELSDNRLDGLKPDWITNAKQMGVFLKDVVYRGKAFTITGYNGYCFLAWDAAYNRGAGANLKFRQDSTPELRRLALGTGSPAAALTAQASSTAGALAQYVTEYNRMAGVFDKPQLSTSVPSKLTPDDARRLADKLAGELSPENLTCDGELRGEALIRRSRYLNAVRSDLESLTGVKVTY